MKLSDCVNRIKPSPTIVVTTRAAELRAQGKDIIGLAAGEPDFDTPQHISNAGIEAIKNGQTRYTPVDGIVELKQAIINKLQHDNGLEYRLNQVLVSCGGKQSFFNLVMALLNPGDEVIIPAPFWVSYPDMVKITGATPVIAETKMSDNFKLSAEQLRNAITDNTRMLVLNSPSNPSGKAYSQAELAELGAVLRQHPQIIIASDDMYEHILWNDAPFHNIASANPDLVDRTVVLNGVSKAYAMTGWRIGYAAGPAELIQAMKKIQSQSTSNPTTISQVAATEAISGDQSFITPMLAAYKQRHDYVVNALNNIEGVSCLESDGTFYAFPAVHGLIERLDGIDNDIQLAEHLLETAGVALVPGSAFGTAGHLRLSFATSLKLLNEAMARIDKAIS